MPQNPYQMIMTVEEKLVKCPVCKDKFWNTGLRNHILNIAVHEVYLWYRFRRKIDKPHQDYVEKNQVPLPKKYLRI